MADPFSVCMVTTFYPPHHFGGDAVYTERLVQALARRGHEVTVVYSADAYRALGGNGDAAAASEPGVTLHPLERRLPKAASLAAYLTGRPAFYGRELAAVLSRGAFDVIHFHNVSLVGGPEVLRYGDAVKVYTTHEHWLVCPMHVLFRDNREPCDEPHCLRCTLRFHRPPQLWRSTRVLERSVPEVDLFLAPSRFTIEAHRARGFTRPMRCLPPFVPEPGMTGESYDNDGRPYFLFAGRLERVKGVHVLLEAFRRFRDADLFVAGEGTLAAELRGSAADLRHVRFLGPVDGVRLSALYAGATALLVPSVGYETFGLVGAEAMAHGTPVIVNDIGPLPELVADSGGGLVYSTVDELVATVGRMLDDPSLRSDLGSSGRAAWQSLWTEDAHVAGYYDAIAEARERAAA